MNHKIPDVQAGFRKGRGTRDQIANIRWINEKKQESSSKTSISALLTMPKPLSVWITKNWKILKEMGKNRLLVIHCVQLSNENTLLLSPQTLFK